MLQYYFSLCQFWLIKCGFFIHSTTAYIHLRFNSWIMLNFSNWLCIYRQSWCRGDCILCRLEWNFLLPYEINTKMSLAGTFRDWSQAQLFKWQGFTYLSEVGATSLFKWEKKHFDHQSWDTWCSFKDLDRHFKLIKNHGYQKIVVSGCYRFVSLKLMKICINMRMKTCFHSHFYANFHASVTLLFLFGFSWNFTKNVELRNWEWYTPFWEVFAHFLFGKGPVFGPKSGLGKSLTELY